MQIRGYQAALACAAFALPLWAMEATGSFDRTLQVSGPVELDVQNGSGSLIVRAGDSATVKIHGTIRARDGAEQQIGELEKNPPIQQTGNSVRVGPIRDEWLQRHVSINYEILVPQQTRLRSHGGSGHQTVEGIQGPVEVLAGSGGVSIARIGGPVRAQTGSGRVELAQIQGGVDAHTGSGGIQALGVSGAVNAQAGSGSVKVEQVTPGTVDVHTGSGGVDLKLPNSGGYDLDAHTGSGSLTVDQPMTVRGTISRHAMRGQIRGGGSLLRVSTGSGSVRIE
jgi:hypothetical protein